MSWEPGFLSLAHPSRLPRAALGLHCPLAWGAPPGEPRPAVASEAGLAAPPRPRCRAGGCRPVYSGFDEQITWNEIKSSAEVATDDVCRFPSPRRAAGGGGAWIS